MWALRRAAIPMRRSNPSMLISRACCAESDKPMSNLKHVDKRYERVHIARGAAFPEKFFHGPFFSTLSFLGSRIICSQAGERTNTSNNEDGFSDLEALTESDKLDNIVEAKDDRKLLPEEFSEDDSEEDSAEIADNSLALTEAKTDSHGEKGLRRKNPSSPLFKVLMETPRHLVTCTLGRWVEEGNPLGRDEVSITLVNLRKRRFYAKALQFAEWFEATKLLNFVERDYASHLDLVAKVHGLQKAEKYIDQIPESFRGEVVYRTLLANCVSATNVKKAEEVFNNIKELGLPITSFSCNQLLLLYKRVERRKIADVLLMMEKENVRPSHFTYRILIDSKGRSNDIAGIEQIVEMMKAEGMEPDIMIQALVAGHYIFAGLNEKAEAALKEMEGDDIKENRDACKGLLPLYAALGKADDVARIWKACEDKPRLDECLAAIEAWGKLGCVEKAEEVFENLLKTREKLSSKYYEALLRVYANHKLLSKGKDLAKRMQKNWCRFGPLTWDALVKLYTKAGEVEKADSMLQKAAEMKQTRPLYSSYLTVLDEYSKRGDVHNAEKIFHRLRQIGYTRRMQQYQLLLKSYLNAKTPVYGFRERMVADEIFPNKQFAVLLMNADAFRRTEVSELID